MIRNGRRVIDARFVSGFRSECPHYAPEGSPGAGPGGSSGLTGNSHGDTGPFFFRSFPVEPPNDVSRSVSCNVCAPRVLVKPLDTGLRGLLQSAPGIILRRIVIVTRHPEEIHQTI